MKGISGSITSLWRYPVKSLLGEKLDSMGLDQRGVVNDRLFAISDQQGKFGSGKNTRRFVRMDGLFSMSAACTENGVSITFPDGKTLSDKSADIEPKLSQTLGQTVKLTREQEVPHFDAGAVHILTLSNLAELQKALPNAVVDERRFRANIIIDTNPPITDTELVGKIIKIGDVKLKVKQKTERCRMITLEQSDLGSQPEILKTVYRNYVLNFGVYASVIDAGIINFGDRLIVE